MPTKLSRAEPQHLQSPAAILYQRRLSAQLGGKAKAVLKGHVPVRAPRIVASYFERQWLAGGERFRRKLQCHVTEQIAGFVGHERGKR